MSSTVAVPMSVSENSTGIVSARTIASRTRIAAQRRRCISAGPRLVSGLLARRERSIARASPTVTTEPVTSTPAGADGLADRSAGLGQRRGLVDRVGEGGGLGDPVAARRCRARPRRARRRASSGRWSSGCRRRGPGPARARRAVPRRPCPPSPTTTPDRAARRRSCPPAPSTRAAAPCGLWAASSRIVGERRMISSRPGEVTSAKASATTSASSGVRHPPRNASTAASASAAFCAWWAPYSGTNSVLVGAAQALQADHLAAHRRRATGHAEVDALAHQGRADLGTALDQHPRDLVGLHGGDRRRRRA